MLLDRILRIFGRGSLERELEERVEHAEDEVAEIRGRIEVVEDILAIKRRGAPHRSAS